jgi:short-subunit dehydrogenase
MQIHGTCALITGASSGIGAATARTLAARGASVVLVARNAERLEAVVRDIRLSGGQAEAYDADLADSAEVSRVARLAVERHGVPDILVNNAGAGRWLRIEETTADELAAMMAVPAMAAFNLTRELLPGLRRRGSGHIVNVASIGAFLAWPGAAGYLSARWAVRGFHEALRSEVRGSGIGVSLVAFSQVSSGYWEHNPGSWERLPAAAHWRPTLTPEDAATEIALAVERNRRLVLRPRLIHALRVVQALFPRLVERQMWRGAGD